MIASYLNRNKPALENMLAEVRSQSADDLVDGITSSEERRYSYNHYYGSRYAIFPSDKKKKKKIRKFTVEWCDSFMIVGMDDNFP